MPLQIADYEDYCNYTHTKYDPKERKIGIVRSLLLQISYWLMRKEVKQIIERTKGTIL